MCALTLEFFKLPLFSKLSRLWYFNNVQVGYFLPYHLKSLPQLVALFIYQSEYMRSRIGVQAHLMDV